MHGHDNTSRYSGYFLPPVCIYEIHTNTHKTHVLKCSGKPSQRSSNPFSMISSHLMCCPYSTPIYLYLLIEPLQLIVLGKYRSVLETPIHLVGRLLGMETMELGLGLLSRVKHAEENVAGPILGHGGNPHAAEEVVAVGRGADADLVKVGDGEAGQVVVAQVGDGLEVLLFVLVVVVAEVDEFLFEGVLELAEGFDGLGLGGVGRRPGVYGCFGGLVFVEGGGRCLVSHVMA